MSKDSTIYLADILDAISKIETYTKGVDEEEFTASSLLQDAAIRRIAIIGQAARNLPQEIKDQYPEIPWQRIIGMRNRVIHEYRGVDVELTWGIIQKDLPKLKGQIQEILDAQR